MFAKITTFQFHSGTAHEALTLYQEAIATGARYQSGFQGAFLLQSQTEADKGIIISLWETEEDMQRSKPPEHVLSHLARIEECTLAASQDICKVLFEIDRPPAACHVEREEPPD
jgi:heme-degrading monooxygenase HmoA